MFLNIKRNDTRGASSFTPVQGGSSERVSYHPFPPSQQTLPRSRFTSLFFGWKYASASWLNILLFCVPASWAISITISKTHAVTFILSILALVPLVRLHDICTTDLANRIGGARTGLLNGSMTNFVEIVVAISALRKCELKVVQSMLMGSMLSKLLLVLGLCFLAGGMKFSEQDFDPTATQIHSSLLSLSVGAVLLPAAYHFMLDSNAASIDSQRTSILKMSRAVSIILLFIYLAYLVFQLWSHTHLYRDQRKKSNRLSATIRENKRYRQTDPLINLPLSRMNSQESGLMDLSSPNNPIFLSRVTDTGRVPFSLEPTFNGSTTSFSTHHHPFDLQEQFLSEISQRKPRMSWFLTISLLVIVTGVVAVTVDLLVASMDEISPIVSKEWVGLILLPAISSVAECISAVRVSVKDELTLSVSVAVGSTIQTALFVIPLTVILAWITKKPLSLLMDPFQSMVLYIAVNTMGYVVADGKSNWLEGVILICLYIIVAVSFWFYPGSDILNTLAACNH